MLSTIQLFLALGADRTALAVDLVLSAVAGGVVAAVITRSGRRPTAVTAADPAGGVVAEAEAVVHEAASRQPA